MSDNNDIEIPYLMPQDQAPEIYRGYVLDKDFEVKAMINEDTILTFNEIEEMFYQHEDLLSAVKKMLALIEEGKNIEDAFEPLSAHCDNVGISPDPCPLCGRYSPHVHEFD